MKFTYLLIDILTLAGPILLSFDKRVAFFSKLKHILPAIVIPAILYLIWDVAFVRLDVWHFSTEYILGSFILNLPFEEVFFFLAIPYACLFIYECLKVYIPNWNYNILAKSFAWCIIILCTIALYYYYDRIYTAITAILLIITLLNHVWVTRGNYLTHLFLAWLIALIPMSIVNGLLTSLPVLIYNNQQNSGYRIGSIPIEDFFYNLLFMTWMVWIFEWYRQKPIHKAAATSPKKAVENQ